MHISSNDRSYRAFIIGLLLFGIANALYRGVFDTYLAQELLVSKAGRGVVEFFRELPGLLLFLILALLYRAPLRLLFIIGYGTAVIGLSGFISVGQNTVIAVAFLTLFSTGQHILMPVRQSYVVHSAQKHSEGRALGAMRSVQSIGRVVGFFIVPLIFQFFSGHDGFIFTFILAILLSSGALLSSLFLERDAGSVKRQRIYVHRKYLLYYLLQSFYGARKQVFLTFAPYVLILKYGANASTVATLLGLSAALNIVVSPLIGRIIDRLGFKIVMVGDTVLLFFICMMYGFAHHIFTDMHTAFIAVCITFILDILISNASMAGSVYVRVLSDDRDEMTATLTTGLSLDHLISVGIVLIGGFIWEYVGIELLFCTAAVLALLNSFIASRIRTSPDS